MIPIVHEYHDTVLYHYTCFWSGVQRNAPREKLDLMNNEDLGPLVFRC